jgi:hypothetical protein
MTAGSYQGILHISSLINSLFNDLTGRLQEDQYGRDFDESGDALFQDIRESCLGRLRKTMINL